MSIVDAALYLLKIAIPYARTNRHPARNYVSSATPELQQQQCSWVLHLSLSLSLSIFMPSRLLDPMIICFFRSSTPAGYFQFSSNAGVQSFAMTLFQWYPRYSPPQPSFLSISTTSNPLATSLFGRPHLKHAPIGESVHQLQPAVPLP
jgi:hypothetical protein